MRQSISIFGLGYVGSVTAGCLAMKGHRVVGVDVNPDKVAALNAGRSPVLEPGLDECLGTALQEQRVSATTDPRAAIEQTDMSFVCVGTPSLANGKLDLDTVEAVCGDIGRALATKNGRHTVVVRSTVLPGTAESLVIPALERSSGRQSGVDFHVCNNPEFLREGTAVADFLEPPMTVIGSADEASAEPLAAIYDWAPAELFRTSIRAAEMIKYSCNCFHALKIAFANEIGTLCKALDVDAEEVTRIFTADTRLNISPAYLKPGFAFGGSCLPKDLRALGYRAKELDLELPLLGSVMPSNDQHLERAVELVLRHNRREVALFGLSFKPATDDLRESPQVRLVKRLLGEGCNVRIWDPHVSMGRIIGSNRAFIEQHIPHIGSLLHDGIESVLDGAEVVVLATTAISADALVPLLDDGQVVVDLVHLAREARPAAGSYEGICW